MGKFEIHVPVPEDRFIDLFSLSVFRRQLQCDETYREQLCRHILSQSAGRSETQNGRAESFTTDDDDESAWLGDTAGHEFLFRDPLFAPLFENIGGAIKSYTHALGLNNDCLSFWFQRSWATVSRQGQRIFEHAHKQSHLSFAYYLNKPKDGGGIYFSIADHPNEFATGLFSLSKEQMGIIARPGSRTLNRIYVEPEEGEILIFPSRTLHSTAANMTDQPRISISADVIVTLRDSAGHETLMPSVDNWRQF